MPAQTHGEAVDPFAIHRAGTPKKPAEGAMKKDIAREILDLREEAEAQRLKADAIRSGLGLEQKPPATPAEPSGIRANLDLGVIITNALQTTAKAREEADRLANEARTEAQRVHQEATSRDLSRLEKELEEARSSNSVEAAIGAYRQVSDLIAELRAESAPRAATATSDQVMIELKKMDLESQDRQRQWELEKMKWQEESQKRHEEVLLAIQDRKEAREDAKEEAKYKRDQDERHWQAEQAASKRRGDTLTTMLGAVTKSVDAAMGVEQEPAPAAASAESIPMEEVECQECHAKETIRSDAKAWTCPSCKTQYTAK